MAGLRPLTMDEDDLHQPNDKLLKATFSNPVNARAFFQHHLPAQLAPLFLWDSLQLLPSSFIDPQFESSESDLLFSVRFQEAEVLLYILFEHQSTEDPRIALRVLAYVVRVWQRFAEEHPSPAKLPPVFPLVLVQGRRPWKTSNKLEDILEMPPQFAKLLAPWQPTLKVHIMELVRTPYESLGGTPEGILTLRALKAEPVSDLLTDWIWDETLLPQISGDGLERLLRYILNSDVDASAFLSRTRRIQTQPLNAKTMTLADRLVQMGREEGRSEGLSQGISQGLSQGETVAMRRAVVRALEAKFQTVPPSLVEAVERLDDIARLGELVTQAVRAQTLEDFAQNL